MNELSAEAMELQREMDQIRCDLYGDVNDLSDDAKQLTDYRYHVRRHPWLTLAAAAAAGFLLVPQRPQTFHPDAKTLEKLIKKNQLLVQTKEEAAQKKGLIATGVSLLAAAALRAAVAYAGQTAQARLATTLSQRQQPSPTGPSYPARPR